MPVRKLCPAKFKHLFSAQTSPFISKVFCNYFIFKLHVNIIIVHKYFILLFACISANIAYCQNHLRYFKITSHYTSFPDTGRAEGHLYDSVFYSTPEHYSDSSVLIITPEHFNAGNSVDLIFWFHGWNNNIDTAIIKYGLARQFEQSKINAVLVLAETAKNSPDSYGGKLEYENTFAMLASDVINKLVKEKLISKKSKPGNILLMGHSGAYRVMAHILDNGNLPVSEVVLFDALYADTESFIKWITANSDHRFINIYTDHGGTLEETKSMIQQLNAMQVPLDSEEETQLTNNELQSNRVMFIHTTQQHDYIIQNPDNFKLYLENSPFLKKESK